MNCWHLVSRGRLYAPEADDAVVWFDSGSGHTHLIDPIAAHVLELLGHESLDETTLAARLHDDVILLDDGEEPIPLNDILESLAAAELIEPTGQAVANAC